MNIVICLQVVYRELFLAGFDISEESSVFNSSTSSNYTADNVGTVELMGFQCGKECYAIGLAAALTFLAGVYQVRQQNTNQF